MTLHGKIVTIELCSLSGNFWPKEMLMILFCEINVSHALHVLKEMDQIIDIDFHKQLWII